MQILTGDFIESKTNTYNKELIKFPYECDHFQKHAFKCIDEGSNVLITAHTGSGKTAVAIYAIAHCIKNGKKAIYTSPIKSLSNEKYKDFKDRFGDKFKEETGLDISLGLLTGDNKINPNGNLLIMTAEILCNSLFKTGFSINDKKEGEIEGGKEETYNIAENIGCIIMDEVHFINDPDRGKVWEQTIVIADQSIQLIMLSATIDKPDEFASWIGSIREKKVYLIPTNHRVVPLDHYIYINDKIHKIMDTRDNYIASTYKTCKDIHLKKIKDKEKLNLNLIQEIIKYIDDNELLQTIFFSFSRKNCETYAKNINERYISEYQVIEINHIWDKYLYKEESKYNCLDQYITLKKLVQQGIAFHHSGLIPILKEIVEILFQKGLVKILFATETFAVGVNMPTRSVVFTELEKYTNGGKRFLNTAEYKQMSGRAGRRGIDSVGYSIILPLYNFPDESDIKTVLTGKVPKIISKFNIDYNFVLKILINNNSNNSSNNNDIIGKSLKEQEKVLIKSKLEKELIELNNSISKYDITSFNQPEFKKIKFLIDQEAQTKKFSDMGLNYSMNNKDKKEYANIQKELKNNNDFKKLYDNYSSYNILVNSKKKKDYDLTYLNDENNIMIQTIISILTENKYVDIIDDKISVLQKGLIASQINECNSLLFTEMCTSGIFDDLTEVDIVALLSIFIDEKAEEDVFKSDLIYTSHLSNKISQIEKFIDMFITCENKTQMHSPDKFWNISINNLDVAYMWASGSSILHIKKEGLINYEGNFIRNMTKIYNIVNDVIIISRLIGNVQLLPKLEKIPQLIIRDIVSLSSLYFIS
jgi:superfamily II RNA helicase